MGSTNESISELLYRINLQRRANTRLIMRSSVNELHTGESGFDSNWTYLHGKLEFESQKYIGAVNQVASLRCSIQPKSMLQM